MKIYDIIIIGAGAAGLSAAATALIREKAVALIDMGNAPARKLSISGGGKCNFTNLAVSSSKYFGNNPNFVNGVINKISPQYFINWIEKHGLEFEKKSSGQYFCATNAKDIVSAMKNDARNADIILNSTVLDIEKNADIFYIKTKEKIFMSKSVIIATGGISYPALGVSDFGYKIAKKFGHKIIPIRPALCAISTKVFPSNLAGISLKVEINIENEKINDFMLITHFGIGGPVIYRTTARNIEKGFKINLLPDINIFEWLKNFKNTEGKKNLGNILSYKLPKRLAKWLSKDMQKNIADYKDIELKNLSKKISNIEISKDKFNLYNLQSAEVVRGGVSTEQISPKTMESKLCSGLFFTGEVLDITGDLGGFNIHWAFASGRIAGENA